MCNVIGVTPSQESLAMLTNKAEIESIGYFSFSVASMGYAALHGVVSYQGIRNDVPVVGLRFSLWGDERSGEKVGVEGAVDELETLQRSYHDPSSPLSYSLVG